LQIGHDKINQFAIDVYKLIENKNFKTLLDLGCGNGKDSLYFAAQGLDVTSVDISSRAFRSIRTENPNVKCLQEDIRKVDFPDNSFDVIYAHFSFHYFNDEDTEEIFKNAYRMLAPNGLLFVRCISTNNALYGKGIKVGENMYDFKHVRHFFDTNYMEQMLKSTGFLVERSEEVVYEEGIHTAHVIEGVGKK